MLTRSDVEKLVEQQLSNISDAVLLARIRELLVSPYPVERDWDYGAPGQKYTCWTILEHLPSNTGIAYSEGGFGPTFPWGIVFLSGPHMNIGMDAGWYDTLKDAMLELVWEG